ncbi:AAA family ATPase, partial [Halomonas sp. DQ26W]
MMTQPLLDTLRHLKLTGMHDALAHQLTQPDTYDLPFEDR